MPALIIEPSSAMTGDLAMTELRAIALRDANRFRALAWTALRDGSPRGDLRAANARAAARSVLRHARSFSRPVLNLTV